MPPPHSRLEFLLGEIIGDERVFSDVEECGVAPVVQNVLEVGVRLPQQRVAPFFPRDGAGFVPIETFQEKFRFRLGDENAVPFQRFLPEGMNICTE